MSDPSLSQTSHIVIAIAALFSGPRTLSQHKEARYRTGHLVLTILVLDGENQATGVPCSRESGLCKDCRSLQGRVFS